MCPHVNVLLFLWFLKVGHFYVNTMLCFEYKAFSINRRPTSASFSRYLHKIFTVSAFSKFFSLVTGWPQKTGRGRKANTDLFQSWRFCLCHLDVAFFFIIIISKGPQQSTWTEKPPMLPEKAPRNYQNLQIRYSGLVS